MGEKAKLTKPSKDNIHLLSYPENALEDVYDGIDKKMVDFMFERTKQYNKTVAMEYLGSKITYEQMKANIAEYARALRKFGIGKGDFISICLPNMPEEVYLKYACSLIGATANMIDPRTNPNGIKDRVNFSNSKLLFMVQNLCKEKIEPIKSQLRVENVISISPVHSLSKNVLEQNLETLPANILYSVKDFIEKNRQFLDSSNIYRQLDEFLAMSLTHTGSYSCEYEPYTPVTALYTSGTTADSMKAGLFSNENYNAMVKNMSYGSKYIHPQKRFLGAIPFFSAYGSFCGFHHSFANAWTVNLVPKFKPTKYAQLILDTKSNAALGVPKFWDQLASMKIHDEMCKHIEIPVVGGDWMSLKSITDVNKALEEGGSKVHLKIGYGSTEFGGVVCTTSDDFKRYNPHSVGIVLPANEVMVIDPETEEELGYNEFGELCITGPTMMLGYLNDEEATKAITVYKNGKKYYRTGDKMAVNEEGDLLFEDRFKRVMMRPDGHTVACSPIEEAIMTYPDVENCAVVGIKLDKDSNGSIPTAFIELKDHVNGSNKLALNIDKHCLQSLGERERALVISFIDKIPYTPNGKVDFMKLSSKRFEDMQVYIIEDTFFEKAKQFKFNMKK